MNWLANFFQLTVALNHIIYWTSSTMQKRESSKELYVGAIFEENNLAHEIAFKNGLIAANILLRSSKLFNTELVPAIERVPKHDSFQAYVKACSLLPKGLVALYGPSSSLASNQVQSMCNRYGIPHLQTQWGYQQREETYSVNVHPYYKSFDEMLLALITRVENWENLFIIYSDDDGLLKFQELLNSFEGFVLVRQWRPIEGTFNHLVKFIKNSHHTNFIVDLPYWKIKDFLIMASVYNMTTSLHSYIFTTWDVHLVDLSAFKLHDGANLTSFSMIPFSTMSNSYQYGNKEIDEMRRDIHKAEQKRTSFDIAPLLTTESALIYDALILLAHGLIGLSDSQAINPSKLSCDSNKAWSVGLSLNNAIKSMPPPEIKNPLSGKTVFDHNGFRTDFNMTIIDATKRGFGQFGYWTKQSGVVVTKVFEPKAVLNNNLSNQTLRITTVLEPPFVINIKKDENGQPLPDPSAWEGFSIEILEKVAKELKFNYTIQLAPDLKYGAIINTSEDGTQNWDGMIGQLLNNKADMAVGSLTISYERILVIDFTTPFMSLGLSIMFKKPKTGKPHIFTFLSPLSAPVWGYIFMAYVTISLILFVVARFSPYEWFNPHPCNENCDLLENQFSLLNSLWFTIGSLMQQGSELSPKATSTRILSGIWWFFTLIVISSYTANLAAFLTVERMNSPIESAEDLVKQTKIKYGTIKSGSTYDFFNRSTIKTYKKMWDFMRKNPDVFVSSNLEGIERVEKEDYAFLVESSVNDYYTQRRCKLMRVGGYLDQKGYGIGFQRGSKYKDAVSEAILQLQKSQEIEKLRRSWFNKYKITEPCSSPTKESKALGVEQVGGVFVILVAGTLISICVALIEFVHKSKRLRKKGAVDADKSLTVCQEIGPELKFAMHCLSSSKRPKRGATPNMRRTPPAGRNGGPFLARQWSGSALNETGSFQEKLALQQTSLPPHFTGEGGVSKAAVGPVDPDGYDSSGRLSPRFSYQTPTGMHYHPQMSQPWYTTDQRNTPVTFMERHPEGGGGGGSIVDRYSDQLPELRMKKVNC